MFSWVRGVFTWIAGKLCGPPSMSVKSTRERLKSLSPGDYVTIHLHRSSGGGPFDGVVTTKSDIGVSGNAVFMDRIQEFRGPVYKSFSFPLRAIHSIEVEHGPHDG